MIARQIRMRFGHTTASTVLVVGKRVASGIFLMNAIPTLSMHYLGSRPINSYTTRHTMTVTGRA